MKRQKQARPLEGCNRCGRFLARDWHHYSCPRCSMREWENYDPSDITYEQARDIAARLRRIQGRS